MKGKVIIVICRIFHFYHPTPFSDNYRTISNNDLDLSKSFSVSFNIWDTDRMNMPGGK